MGPRRTTSAAKHVRRVRPHTAKAPWAHLAVNLKAHLRQQTPQLILRQQLVKHPDVQIHHTRAGTIIVRLHIKRSCAKTSERTICFSLQSSG